MTREQFIQTVDAVNRLFTIAVDQPEEAILESLCEILQTQVGVPLVWISEQESELERKKIRAVAGPLAKDFQILPMDHRKGASDDHPEHWAWTASQSFSKRHKLGKHIQMNFVWPGGQRGKIVLQQTRSKDFPEEVTQVLKQVTADLESFLRRQSDQLSLQRTRVLQQALLRAGEIMLAAEDQQTLLQQTCQQLIDSGIFIAAWVAHPAADECMDALAYAGWSAPNALKRRWPISADLPEGQTVGARAWRANTLVVQQDYLADPLIRPWREQALEYGWRAAAALPIYHDGVQWAILAVIGEKAQMFSEEICDLLRQVARLVGHGLDEQALKQSLAKEKMHLAVLAAQDATMRRYQAAVMKIQCDLLDRTTIEKIFPELLHTLVRETGAVAAYIALPETLAARIESYFLNCPDTALRAALDAFVKTQNVVEWPAEATLMGHLLHLEGVHIHSSGQSAPMAGSLFAKHYPHLQDRISVKMLWPIASSEAQKLVAVLGIFSADPGHFTEAVQQVYGQLANSIGLALRQDRNQKALEESRLKLEQVAFYDPLTGLANRRLLESQLEQAMARHQRQDHVMAVCMLDLDQFKPINDQFGHETGDEVLVTLGRRLPDVLRKNDMVGRFGGDEFVILLEDVQNQDDLYQILRKIEDVITSPIQLQNGQNVRVGLSMGISLFPGGVEVATPEGLLRHADRALYESKHTRDTRDACWVLHESTVALERAPLAQRLLAIGQLLVLYQPVWNYQVGKVAGMEALARLHAEDGRTLTPREFLPQLRGPHLCHLTQRMLVQALEDLNALGELGEDLWISVNIDPQSLNKPCIHQIRQIILDSGINPSRIVLEILEGSDFLERNSALELLRQIRDLGVRLALDDVGSAYASLLRLKELPVDEIKLDQGFIRTLAQRPDDLHFVLAVRDLAQGLEVDLVVEGVENAAVLDAMVTLNIAFLQGRGIAKPMPFSRLRSWLKRKHPVLFHPSTLLGVYAAQMSNHSVLTKMARQNPQLLDAKTLRNECLCPIHDYLQRLGSEENHALLRQHHLYHHELSSLLRQLAIDPEQANWVALNQCEETFLRLLRQAWQGKSH